ncbi:ribonuclease P protein component [marine gamma proteobacterium HTCC2207]|jgi:ribonuclease P protein component|uniref:Ribonuclease P protein component n=1 Tax=gamma proteobacterium HTCC2207 TaxID=314287 RepID=Q1YV33_9GAMM|nr:ribonuclease P protein component [marine gamma proteobacterium HTCC2207] [gamma proteobacterium HTCC2207]MBT5106385.1 ribonuclease P protein component [Porticoccaceae bacterium]MBT6115387.1 ribonuclease P protein component [Porticoccaceae bacterium]MBT6592745.1 ribonuclease P protein component [Porticoccaceae bacterium]MDB4428387.1 ribonuclease P protein component [Porticoccaceae bacterium]
MPGAAFGKNRRLLKSSDYTEVFDNNSVRVAHPNLLILSQPNGTETSRLGLVIGKKNVPTAVARNKIKRVVRETFRLTELPVAVDLVFLARKDLGKLSSAELAALIRQSWGRLTARLNKEINRDA